MQGGGWCNSVRACVYRKTTRRGSSNYMEKQLAFTGILSNKAVENPGLVLNLKYLSLYLSPLALDISNIIDKGLCRFFQLEQSKTSIL